MNESRHQQNNLTIEQVEAYLASQGWYRDGFIKSLAGIWHHKDKEEAEVVLPLSNTVREYGKRFAEALVAISEFERRSTGEIINDIAQLIANVITVRVKGEDTKGGTIPINDGVLLFSKAKDLMYSAALSLRSKRRQFIGPPSKEVKEYVDSLLLGQTEVGSYIVNVIAPVPPQQPEVPQMEKETSVAAGVTLNLVCGLEAITKASAEFSQSQSLRVFDAAIEKGLSSNMCDALLGFSGIEHRRQFEICISGANPMFGRITKVFKFDADEVATVRMASDYYKGDYMLKNRRVWGFVKKLDRPKGEEIGTITVEAVVDGVDRSVKIELGPEEYHQGVLAHDMKALVECSGNIHIKNRRAQLFNPTGFRIISTKDLF